jgi:hypothetical protein
MYEVRRIRYGDGGTWRPGREPDDLIWRGRSRARAKAVAVKHAWDGELGTCIVALKDGRPVRIDWGDHEEAMA